MEPVFGPFARPLTVGLAIAAVASSAFSLLRPSLLSGVPVLVGNLRGTALAVLLVVVPTLLLSAWYASGHRGTDEQPARESGRVALIVWLGAAASLVYQGVMFCFATPMNPLFLLYVATLGFALWTVIAVWPSIPRVARDWGATSGAHRAPYRSVAVVLGVAALLNVLVWLARAAPVMTAGELPTAVSDSGLTTNPVLVQDLAFWLPTALVVSMATWRRSATATFVAGAFLVFWVLEGVTVASDQWWGVRADDGYPELASTAVVPGALIVTAILVVPLWMLCRSIAGSSSQGARDATRRQHENGARAGAAGS